jgi:hypothetical protein
MPDYLGPAQIMAQQLHGAMQEAAQSAENERATLARQEMQRQRMGKEMEVNFSLAEKLMPVDKAGALDAFNAALKPMGRAVTMEQFDPAMKVFQQAAEFKQNNDPIGMAMLLKHSDKYLINLDDQAKALRMEQSARQDLGGQQAQALQNLQPEPPQLARSRQLLSMAGMVGGDLSRIEPDQLTALTGSTDPQDHEHAVQLSQAVVDGYDRKRQHLSTMFSLDPTAFPHAAAKIATTQADPEILAKGRFADLAMLPARTEAEEREMLALGTTYLPHLAGPLGLKTAAMEKGQLTAKLEDTRTRLSALDEHLGIVKEASGKAVTLQTDALVTQASDPQAKEYLLKEGLRSVEGYNFLHLDKEGKYEGHAAPRVNALERAISVADIQREALWKKRVGALPGPYEVMTSQIKEFEAMATANKAMLRLLKEENPYALATREAEIALMDDQEQQRAGTKVLQDLRGQRDTDMQIVQTERARLARREAILQAQMPAAERKEEQERQMRAAHQSVDVAVAKGIPLAQAIRDAGNQFQVEKADLAKGVMEARGAGVPEAQVELLTMTREFRRKNGREPEPGDVASMLVQTLRRRPGLKGEEVMAALKDVNRPGVEVNLYEKKQSVAEAGKLANVNQAISELQQVRHTFVNPDGTINRGQMLAGAWSLPFTKGKGAAQFIEKAVEIKLRAATGAAARPDEMKMYARLFGPSSLDSDEIVKYKLDSFENWMQTVAETTDPAGDLRKRAEALLSEGTVRLLTTPEYTELRSKFPQASTSEIVRFLQQRKAAK